MKKILVIGSLNMDLVTMTSKHPKLGETIIGKRFFEISGGKGGNQAVASGKLGVDVTMLGTVGRDSYGAKLIENLRGNNIDVSYIRKVEASTGIATIVVDDNAHNTIIVVPGANFAITEKDIDNTISLIQDADIVLLQLEIPFAVVKHVLVKAKAYGSITILNPAPAQELTEQVLKNIDFLIPNEIELELLSGMPTSNKEEVLHAGRTLIEKGAKNIIVTMGENGSMYISKERNFTIEIQKVNAVDSTAAGDSFIGGVVRMLVEGKGIEEAMQFGAKVGAITVTKKGAQSSLPTYEEVMHYTF